MDNGEKRAQALDATELVKTYPGAETRALDGFSVSVDEGEVLGLLGPNGAGKTTAISIMCTLLRPDAGHISIYGVDVVRHPMRVRRMIGLVPQEIALYPTLTVRENMSYFGRLHGLDARTLPERIDDCLSMVSLRDYADRRVGTFSGGMKRRANLAAGILHQPRLLFLDEPTVGIDAQSRNVILENLKRLKDDGMTMVYTTHYMVEAHQLCTKVAIVDSGMVIAEGRPQELIDAAHGCSNLEDLFLHLTGRQLRDR